MGADPWRVSFPGGHNQNLEAPLAPLAPLRPYQAPPPAEIVPCPHRATSRTILHYFVCPEAHTSHLTPLIPHLNPFPSPRNTDDHLDETTTPRPLLVHRETLADAAMTKERLDSNRINYLIWRYVFLVIHRLGFQVQPSLTPIASQVSSRGRFVHVGALCVSGPR